jgi:acyl-CoA hydrolase
VFHEKQAVGSAASLGRPVHESRVEMTELVLPPDTNQHGTIFGGRVLQWIDIAGAIAAQRHSRLKVVTASIDEMHFLVPIRLAEVVVLKASVNFVHRSSLEVGVRVEREIPSTGERIKAATAYLTFVCLNDAGEPTAAPPLQRVTDDDHARFAAGEARRARRLEHRDALRGRT